MLANYAKNEPSELKRLLFALLSPGFQYPDQAKVDEWTAEARNFWSMERTKSVEELLEVRRPSPDSARSQY